MMFNLQAGAAGGARVSGAQFMDPIQAAADFLGNGAIEINMYETDIMDMIRRESVFRQRIDEKPATGHPHRYFEQTAIGIGAFSDPRTLTTTPTGPTRVERPAMIKALTNQINLSLFDIQVTQQQGQFTGLEAKDIEDCVTGIILAAAPAYWVGNDTSLVTPTTLQYVGVLTQITLQATIGPGASIIDNIKAMIARMMANTTFKVRPTATYVNPVLGHYIDTEAKASNIQLTQVNVAVGVTVRGINTQAGEIPLIPDPFLPSATGPGFGFSAPPLGMMNYFAAVVTEKLIERPYVDGGRGNPNPQLYRLGLTGSLSGQYVAVQFDTVIVKGPGYAHAVLAIQRP
jgi:hypothetical protein